MIQFTIDVVNQIEDIGPDNVRVGVVLFADNAEVEISLGQYENRFDLVNALRSVDPINGATNLREAMDVTAEQFAKIGADRSGANDIVVILTDASATGNNQATEDAIDRLKTTGEGVHIVPIAVSDDVRLSWLQLLAHNPNVPITATKTLGVDYFQDDQLAFAAQTRSLLFTQKLDRLLTPVCEILTTSSKYKNRFTPVALLWLLTNYNLTV